MTGKSALSFAFRSWEAFETAFRQVRNAALSVPIPLGAPGWIAARCIGGTPSRLYPGAPVFAHTSPINLDGDGIPPERAPAIAALTECLDNLRDWIESQGYFSTPKAKEHLLHQCESARLKL